MAYWLCTRARNHLTCLAMTMVFVGSAVCLAASEPASGATSRHILLETHYVGEIAYVGARVSRETRDFFVRVSRDEVLGKRAAIVLTHLYCNGAFTSEEQKVAVVKICRVVGLDHFRQCWEKAARGRLVALPDPYDGWLAKWDFERVMKAMCAEWHDDALLEFYVQNLGGLPELTAIDRFSHFGDKGLSLLLKKFPEMDEHTKAFVALEILTWNAKPSFADDVAAIMTSDQEKPLVRISAAQALAECGKVEDACSFLRTRDPGEDGRLERGLVAALLAEYGTLADAKRLLQSSGLRTRGFALRGLRRFAMQGDETALGCIFSSIVESPDASLRYAAVHSLAVPLALDPSVSERLVTVARETDSVGVRVRIGGVLLDAGLDSGKQILRQVRDKGKPGESGWSWAVNELARSGDKRALQSLLQFDRLVFSVRVAPGGRTVIVPEDVRVDDGLSRKWITENLSRLHWDAARRAFVARQR